MAGVRQESTKIELTVAAILRELGIHYRKNVKRLPGSPDFANQSARWAIFVNGCFWHHHTNCLKATIPKSNNEFWKRKFRDNRLRDSRAVRKLRGNGYQVILIWECEKDRIRASLSNVFKARCIDTR